MSQKQNNLMVALALLLVVAGLVETQVDAKKYYKTVRDREFFSLTHEGNQDGYFVFFGADWCGHCKNFKPMFESMAKSTSDGKYQTKPVFIHYEMDERDTISTVFRINSFPTLVFIKGDRFCKFKANREEQAIASFFGSNDMKGELCEDYPSSYPGWFVQFKYLALEFLHQLTMEYEYYKKEHPYITYSVLGLFFFTAALSFYASFLCAKQISVGKDRAAHSQVPARTQPPNDATAQGAQIPKPAEQENLEEKKEK